MNSPVIQRLELPDIRNLTVKMDVIKHSDGSACLRQGQTSVIAGVNGPVEVRQHKELIDKTCVDVFYSKKSGAPAPAERAIEDHLKNTCEEAIKTSLHPRTSINITVQEINDDGCLIACAVNACCLALLNAGIPMQFLIAAATCCIDEKGDLIIDPNSLQMENMTASVTVVYESKRNQMLTIDTYGIIKSGQLQECLAKCKSVCMQIFEFYRAHLIENQ